MGLKLPHRVTQESQFNNFLLSDFMQTQLLLRKYADFDCKFSI